MAGKGQKSTGKAKVKVGKLQVNKETVKDLTKGEAKKVKGGARKQTTESISIVLCATCTVRGC